MKNKILKLLPWLITLGAIYLVFCKDTTDWDLFFTNIGNASPWLCLLAILLTIFSYLVRAFRWKYFFDNTSLSYINLWKVLILGFFMNNVLPARTGELVRAHMGAKVSGEGEKRTSVLATIASERLTDGLTLSLMFLFLTSGVKDPDIQNNLYYVALLFAAATIGILTVLFFRKYLFQLTEHLKTLSDKKSWQYGLDRFEVFINGLEPLFRLSRVPVITISSLLTWFIELAVFYSVSLAFNVDLSLSYAVLFMVTVNFSALLPLTPGAVGVIEAITTVVLVSLGVPKEAALPMIITQHLIQYLVVGVPGIWIMITWKKKIAEARSEENPS